MEMDDNCDQNIINIVNLTETDANLSQPSSEESSSKSGEVQRRALMVTQPHAEEYLMSHPKRGKAVIFNHQDFVEKVRLGTQNDVDRIKQVFGELLQFEIEVFNDLEYHQIKNIIIELSEKDYTYCDCIAIFVLSHGRQGGEVSAKDMSYPVQKLTECFTGDKCTTLAGKPKLFFISACRGKNTDKAGGIRLFSEKTQTDSANNQLSFYKIPLEADFLIANSTTEGYPSFRDPVKGTWFIQCLCDVITQYYKTTDLLKMLTITSRKVAIDCRTISDKAKENDLTQVPEVKTTLIRDVYFHSKNEN